jgi:hypothetical protein
LNISFGAKLRERSINSFIAPWPPSRAKISEVIADKDREVIIHPCKMFLSEIEAIVKVSGDFIEQLCM